MKRKKQYKILIVITIVILITVIILLSLRSPSKKYITVDEFAFNPNYYLNKTITLRGVYFDNNGYFGSIVSNNARIGWISLDFGDWNNKSFYENNTELVNEYNTLHRNKMYDFTGIMGHEQKIYDENGNYVLSNYVFTVSDVKPVS